MESKEIQTFREEWKKELDAVPIREDQHSSFSSCSGPEVVTSSSEKKEIIPEEGQEFLQAADLFNKAVWLEDRGEVYEAIKFYKKAINLIPDIEFRVYRQNMLERREGPPAKTEDSGLVLEDEDNLCIEDLVAHFGNMLQTLPFCEPMYSQEAVHISCLPPEMFDHILSWVVGDQLDLQSLDRLSAVCRGFYVLCRDPELWKRACFSTWGINTGTPECYGSWRDMYIMRPRLKFHGCYISRTTYFRKGEAGFQDQSYEPYQFVSYYRYLRFFPTGVVWMLTSTDEPQNVVSQFKNKEIRNSQIMEGHYRLQNCVVTMLFRKISSKKLAGKGRSRRRDYGTTDVAEANFKIEMEIRAVKHRLHSQLTWNSYQIVSVYYTGAHTSSCVDVQNGNSFPSLLFSKVKSFNKESISPLP